jgi:Ser/Thr protein kinase RdoA (MazF antagonist)
VDNQLQEALSWYCFVDPDVVFIRHNENKTYKVRDQEHSYVLRIHQPVEGYSLGILAAGVSPLANIRHEMAVLEHLHTTSGLPLQQPVKNREGQRVTRLTDGAPVTVMQWIEGFPLSDMDTTTDIGHAIGSAVARFHLAAQTIQPAGEGGFWLLDNPDLMQRYSYDPMLLARISDELRVAEQQGHIAAEHLPIALQAVATIRERMEELEAVPGTKGYVHADLSRSNLIRTLNDEVVPIDFSLSGIGYYAMDIGMLLTDFADKIMRNSIKEAYEQEMGKEVSVACVEAFFAFGVILYIACQHHKAYQEDWFAKAMDRWCNTIFAPLVRGEAFVL